jgi:multidomain signaling protein FimX
VPYDAVLNPQTPSTGTAAVPLVVASPSQAPVEALNGLLRREGIPSHCTWIPALQDLAAALVQFHPELLVCVVGNDIDAADVAQVRDRVAKSLPLLIVRPEVDEAIIASDLARGARDTVSLANPSRLCGVLRRELLAYRIDHALQNTLRSARDSRVQLQSVLTRSHDAIALVQEGILVEANASWLELLGFADQASAVGQPIMDLFDAGTHAALRNALIACQQGRWSNHTLKVEARTADGGLLPLEITLALGEREGESCVHLIVPAQKHDERQLAQTLDEAVRRNPTTGVLYRAPLLEAIGQRFAAPVQGEGQYLLCIRPDHFASIERDLGVVQSDEFLKALAQLLRSHLLPNDLLGHYSSKGLMALIERGSDRDAQAWAERVIDHVARQDLQLAGKSIKATVTIGLAMVPQDLPSLDVVVQVALDALRQGRKLGGNRLVGFERTDADSRMQSHDAAWSRQIRAALMENRFRLVQQPVASLQGGETGMFDVLVRMIDPQGNEVLPSEFIAAAERNDLLKNIDRWVIGAALQLAARRNPSCLFVRLSRASALDPTLIPWIDAQLRATQIDAPRVCFQVTEEVAELHLQEIRRLGLALRERKLRFALEHFGAGRESMSLLGALDLDYVKIDGALMQVLKRDEAVQATVRSLVEATGTRGIATIAERVEDADTMAVL